MGSCTTFHWKLYHTLEVVAHFGSCSILREYNMRYVVCLEALMRGVKVLHNVLLHKVQYINHTLNFIIDFYIAYVTVNMPSAIIIYVRYTIHLNEDEKKDYMHASHKVKDLVHS